MGCLWYRLLISGDSVTHILAKLSLGSFILIHDAFIDRQERAIDIDGGEILDEMITRSRGEIRHSQSPKITSSTPTSLEDKRSPHSPSMQRAYSPRVRELRVERSPSLSGKGLEVKKIPSPGPSNLGQSSNGSSPC